MKKALKWILGLLVGIGMLAGLTFAFLEGRKEMAREREREMPVKTPPRTSRGPNGEAVVTLDTETRQRVRIAVVPIAAAAVAPEAKGFGTVLDPGGFVALHGELVAAEVALTNSSAQLKRTKALFEEDQNASRRALDAAEAQYRTDAAKLLSTQQRWMLILGDAGGKLNSVERDHFINKLVRREVVLARAEIPPGDVVTNPVSARVALSGTDGPFASASEIYSTPSVDARTRAQAFLLVIDQPGPQLRPGAAITAYFSLSGEKQNGVTLPFGAVVRALGLTWAYVQTGDNQFTRRQVASATPMTDGWFANAGFKPGDQVVVTGAQTLLSEEFKSQISVGDEAEK